LREPQDDFVKPKRVFRADTIRIAHDSYPKDTPSQLARRLGVDRRAVYAALRRRRTRGRPQGDRIRFSISLPRTLVKAVYTRLHYDLKKPEDEVRLDEFVERALRAVMHT
jgi:hypothetical protein